MVQIKYPPVLDISHWIPVADFRALDPLPWLIITKATEGTSYLDATYADYADRIRDAGIRLGAYHFMLPGDEIAQADWFCEILQQVGLQGNEILACDMEVSGISLQQIKNFLDRVQAKTGIRPVIYSTQLLLERLYPNGVCPAWLKAEWLWIAEYPYAPDITHEIPTWVVPRGLTINNIAMWQYSDDGILGDIPGNNVDLNLINPFYMQSIGLTEPNGGPMPYTFSITPTGLLGSAIRPDHNTDNLKFSTGLPYGKLAYGNRKWTATENKFSASGAQVNAIGDVWLEVLEVNGVVLPAPGWIAEIHLGRRYATITQIGTGEPPAEPPAGITIDSVVVNYTENGVQKSKTLP